MAFKSDKQRKKVMAMFSGNQTRSDIKPSIIGRITGLKQKLRERREEKGRERIEKEKISLEQEKITEKRLEKELKVEQAREEVAQQRRETQAEFSRIERERFARSKKGKAFALAKKGAAIGLRKLLEPPKRKPRAKRKKTQEETGFFGT